MSNNIRDFPEHGGAMPVKPDAMPPTQSGIDRGFWHTVPWLMLVVACGHFNRIGISVAGSERIIPQYGLDPQQMGMIYSAFLLCYTVAMIPGGMLIDRYGARAALLVWGIGSTLFVALSGGIGLIAATGSTVLAGLLVVRSVLGVFNAPLHPASARMVYQYVRPESKALANGLVTFAACLGIAATYKVLGGLIDRFDWPAALLISSAITLAVTIVWGIVTRPARLGRAQRAAAHEQPLDWSALATVLRRKSVVFITLSYFAMGYFQYVFFYWIEYFFETVQHESRETARDYSTGVTLAMGVGMIVGGLLTDRMPRRFSPRLRGALVPALSMLSSGLVFELGLLSENPRTTLLAFGLAAACIGACEGSFWTMSVGLGGRFGGVVAALMNTGGNAGGTLSPWILPVLGVEFAEHYGTDVGWRLSLAVAGIVVMLGAALWFGISPPEEIAATPAPDFENGLL
ncbi:MAG TPA: MFS transporter [Pirellulales bacterium]